MDQPDGAVEGDFVSQQQMLAAIVEELLVQWRWRGIVNAGQIDDAAGVENRALARAELRRNQRPSVKSGAAATPTSPATRSGRISAVSSMIQPPRTSSHQNLRSRGQLVEDTHHIVAPATDGAIDEFARRLAMAVIVETDEGLAVGATERLQP